MQDAGFLGTRVCRILHTRMKLFTPHSLRRGTNDRMATMQVMFSASHGARIHSLGSVSLREHVESMSVPCCARLLTNTWQQRGRARSDMQASAQALNTLKHALRRLRDQVFGVSIGFDTIWVYQRPVRCAKPLTLTDESLGNRDCQGE